MRLCVSIYEEEALLLLLLMRHHHLFQMNLCPIHQRANLFLATISLYDGDERQRSHHSMLVSLSFSMREKMCFRCFFIIRHHSPYWRDPSLFHISLFCFFFLRLTQPRKITVECCISSGFEYDVRLLDGTKIIVYACVPMNYQRRECAIWSKLSFCKWEKKLYDATQGEQKKMRE